MKKRTIAALFALPTFIVSGVLVQSVEARKEILIGAVNNSVLLACSNGMRESWTSYHKPRKHNLFDQEIVLSEGVYHISAVPAGRFRFNAALYSGKNYTKIGYPDDTGNFTHRVKVSNWDTTRKFRFQAAKTGADCVGCSMRMTVTAISCPRKAQNSRPNNATICKPNFCGQSGTIFGLPSCVPKRGAKGGYCGTPGN